MARVARTGCSDAAEAPGTRSAGVILDETLLGGAVKAWMPLARRGDGGPMDNLGPLPGLHDALSEGLNAFLSRSPNDLSAVCALSPPSLSRVVCRSGLCVGDRVCARCGMLDRDRARLAFVGD